MEHMNRIVKTVISGLGANKTEKAIIVRAGKSVGLLSDILAAYDEAARKDDCLVNCSIILSFTFS